MTERPVRAHPRRTPSGGTTAVRRHTRAQKPGTFHDPHARPIGEEEAYRLMLQDYKTWSERTGIPIGDLVAADMTDSFILYDDSPEGRKLEQEGRDASARIKEGKGTSNDRSIVHRRARLASKHAETLGDEAHRLRRDQQASYYNRKVRLIREHVPF